MLVKSYHDICWLNRVSLSLSLYIYIAIRGHSFFKKEFIAPIILLLSINISTPLTENKGLRQSYSFLGHLEETLKKLALSVSNVKIPNL